MRDCEASRSRREQESGAERRSVTGKVYNHSKDWPARLVEDYDAAGLT